MAEIPPEPPKNPLIVSVRMTDGDSWVFEKLDKNGTVVQQITRAIPIGHKGRVTIKRVLSTNQEYMKKLLEEEARLRTEEEEKIRQAAETAAAKTLEREKEIGSEQE